MKKIRKKRKLTEEQKKVLVDRISKARAAKKPAAQLSIHETVRSLPDDDIFSAKNIREWIKNAKDKLAGMRSWKNSKEKGQASEYLVQQGYLHNLQAYLRDGVYRDLYYGEERQFKTKFKCVVMAYNKDGTPKRTIGVMYPDIGVYTQEMADEVNGKRTVSNKKQIRKTSRRKSKGASI
jgi:ribosomal protein S8